MKTIDVKNVNGIREFSIDLSAGPGVYVAQGRNGIGKSSLLGAIGSALGSPTAKASVRDGEKRGEVSIDGSVVMRVTPHRRTVGKASVELLGSGPLARLIDPGIKDPKAAAKARLTALLEIAPVPVTPEMRFELAGGDAKLEVVAMDAPDLLTAASIIQDAANELACKCDDDRKFHEGELQASQGLIGEQGTVDRTAPTFDAGQQALQAADRAAERVRGKVETAKRARQRNEEIRASLGPRPDLFASSCAVSEQQAVVDALKAKLDDATALLKSLAEAARKAVSERAEWDKRNALLSEPIPGETDAELTAAIQARDAAQARVEDARKLETVRTLEEKSKRASDGVERCVEQSKRFRGIAQNVALAVRRILEKTKLSDATVIDGQLAIWVENEWRDYATRCSYGQQAAWAIKLAVNSSGLKNPILILDPEYWTSLDPQHRQDLAAEAEFAGAYILTEAPTEGEKLEISKQ